MQGISSFEIWDIIHLSDCSKHSIINDNHTKSGFCVASNKACNAFNKSKNCHELTDWCVTAKFLSKRVSVNAFGSRSNYGRLQTPHLSEALPLSHYSSLLVEAPGWEKGTAKHQKKCPCSKEPHHGNSCHNLSHNQSLPIWSNLKQEQNLKCSSSWQSNHAAQSQRER